MEVGGVLYAFLVTSYSVVVVESTYGGVEYNIIIMKQSDARRAVSWSLY